METAEERTLQRNALLSTLSATAVDEKATGPNYAEKAKEVRKTEVAKLTESMTSLDTGDGPEREANPTEDKDGDPRAETKSNMKYKQMNLLTNQMTQMKP